MSSLVELQKVGADKEILYIESDEKLQKSFGVYLQKTFKKLHLAMNGEDGFEKFQKYKPSVVLMELDLDGKDPIEFIDDIQSLRSDVVIITISEKSDDYELLQTLDMGLAKMLLKPVQFQNLASILIGLLPPAIIKKPPVVKTTPTLKKTVVKQEIKKEPIKKPVAKKVEKKEVEAPKKQTLQTPKKVIEKKAEPAKKEEPKVVPKTPQKFCFEFIETLMEKKALVEFFNSYKGVSVQNFGEIVSVYEDYFEVKVGLTQIIAAKYESFVILRTEENKYIYAVLEQINLKNGSLKLTQPRFLDYKQRDKNYNRFKADKSCKASIYMQKKLVEFSVEYLSFKSAELITSNKEVSLKKGDSFDLTLGFDLGAPNKMIKEKKFVKVFAQCEILRIDEQESFNKVVVILHVKKAGETSLLRYINQREEEIMYEFKRIIHR